MKTIMMWWRDGNSTCGAARILEDEEYKRAMAFAMDNGIIPEGVAFVPDDRFGANSLKDAKAPLREREWDHSKSIGPFQMTFICDENLLLNYLSPFAPGELEEKKQLEKRINDVEGYTLADACLMFASSWQQNMYIQVLDRELPNLTYEVDSPTDKKPSTTIH